MDIEETAREVTKGVVGPVASVAKIVLMGPSLEDIEKTGEAIEKGATGIFKGLEDVGDSVMDSIFGKW